MSQESKDEINSIGFALAKSLALLPEFTLLKNFTIAHVTESHGKLNKTPEWLPDQTPYAAKKARRLSASPTDGSMPSPVRK